MDTHNALTDLLDVLLIGKTEPADYESVKVRKYFTVPGHVGGQYEINDSLYAE